MTSLPSMCRNRVIILNSTAAASQYFLDAIL